MNSTLFRPMPGPLVLTLLFVLHCSAPGAQSAQTTDPQKPWVATGKVISAAGEPLAGVEVRAHTGIGTLLGGGHTVSKEDGSFELHFGPGVLGGEGIPLQAATISVSKPGWFETNLYRQGDLLAAAKLPTGTIGWGNKTTNDIFLPGQPKTLTFVMTPAANIRGVLVDANGAPLKNWRVGLAGDVLPPSCSVFAEIKTSGDGGFSFENLPTTFSIKIYAESENVNWRDWPALTVRTGAPKQFKIRLQLSGNELALTSDPPLEVLGQTSRK